VFEVEVDNDTSTSPPSDNALPSTVEEIIEELKKKIDADPNLIAERTDKQIFVYIEGPTIGTVTFKSGSTSWGGSPNPSAVPLLLAVIPDRGLKSGGEVVTIYGSHIGPNASISFGGIPASIIDYDPGGDTYTVSVPASNTTGLVDVVAIPEGGVQDVYNTLPGEFEYVGPVPAVSEWGLILMAVLIVLAGVIAIVRRRRRIAA
jgi:hypothetical protein